MSVVDASAAVSDLLNDGRASPRALATEQHAPHLIDSEVANSLRRRVAPQQVSARAGWTALDALRCLGMTRYRSVGFVDRVCELRENLSADDASYVALAQLLDCHLLTADARLSRAPGIRCPVTVLPG